MPSVDTARLGHAYIISGQSESARLSLARRLAAAAVCSSAAGAPCGVCRHCRKAEAGIHPDIIFVERLEDKRSITVAQAREMRVDALVMPNDAARKVYIVRDADTMNDPAQNALLKILEEPPKFAVFLLLAENSGLLLETVRSRCVELQAAAVQAEEGNIPEDSAAALIVAAALAGEQTALLSLLLPLEKQDRNTVAQTLCNMKRLAAKELDGSRRAAAAAVIETVNTAEEYLSVNMSTGHIVSLLLSKLL